MPNNASILVSCAFMGRSSLSARVVKYYLPGYTTAQWADSLVSSHALRAGNMKLTARGSLAPQYCDGVSFDRTSCDMWKVKRHEIL